MSPTNNDTGLRDAIAAEVKAGSGCSLRWAQSKADAILAIPEIANGQALLRAKMDELFGGTGFVRIERIDPANVYIEPDETNVG